MTKFESVLSHPLMYALGWALLHFIWQGIVVAILLTCVLFVLRGRAASIRYGVAMCVMLLMPALLAATIWRIWALPKETSVYGIPFPHLVSVHRRPQSSAPKSTRNASTILTKNILAAESPKYSARTGFAGRLDSLLPWLVFVWVIGVSVLSLRFAFVFVRVQHLRRKSVNAVIAYWQKRLARLCKKMKITHPVRLLESNLIQVPTVIGWMRPVILLPASALTGLTPNQLEAILAHELAHIRRYDYLFNLFHKAAEILLFYHPAVWWISHRIRLERERCCDELAVKACGDALTYARALTRLEKLRNVPAQFVISAGGGSLLHRIRHILNTPATQPDCPTWKTMGVCVIITIFIVGVTAHISGVLVAVAEKFTDSSRSETAHLEKASSALIEVLRHEPEQVGQQFEK